MGKRVILRNVRIAFIDTLWEAKSFQNDAASKPSYSAKFIFAPDSDEYKNVKAAIEEVGRAEWKDKYAAVVREIEHNPQKNCLLNGDTKPGYAGYAGNFVVTAKRRQNEGAPLVIDRDKTKIITEGSGKLYAGCEVNAIIEFWAQSGVNKGMRCTLHTVQYVKDGESFGGAAKPSAEGLDDLGYVEDEEDFI
jgi:hypothetical protein